MQYRMKLLVAAESRNGASFTSFNLENVQNKTWQTVKICIHVF